MINSGPMVRTKINNKTKAKKPLESLKNNFLSNHGMPAILPFANINMIDDKPIRTPPSKDK